MTKKPKWISLNEAAELMGYQKPDTFRQQVVRGVIPVSYVKVTRKAAIRFDENDLLRLLNEKAIIR